MSNTFVRDSQSKALINTDTSEIFARRQQKKNNQKLIDLQEQILEVKNDLIEIKNILQSIIAQRG